MNRQIILEALNGIQDIYIEEAAGKLGLLAMGAAAVNASGPVSDTTPPAPSSAEQLFSLSATEPAAKVGFGAWVAKGGWVALVAGALVAAGVAVGAFFLLGGEDLHPAESDTVTAADTEQSTHGDMTDEATGNESDAPPSVTTLPLRLTDFSNVDLSLFSTYQGVITVTPEGKLSVQADWLQGSFCDSSIAWNPCELMPYADAYADSSPYIPGALILKIKRNTEPYDACFVDISGKGSEAGETDSVPAIIKTDTATDYEYILLRTDTLSAYMDASKPIMTLNWLSMGSDHLPATGQSMTIEEMLFYPSSNAAILDFSDYLAENGITCEILYSNINGYCKVIANDAYTDVLLHIPAYSPDGLPVKEIANNAYANNVFLLALSVDEGVEYIRQDAFMNCKHLTVAYLPDSLLYLGSRVFSMNEAMTEIHLGSGLQLIEEFSLPLSSKTFTDIYYNGTISDWYGIFRQETTADHPIAVHCIDGVVDYSDPAPDDPPQKEEEKRDLTEILAKAPPMKGESNEVFLSSEARVIRLKQGSYGEYQEFILRWGLFEANGTQRYGFDVLSIEDGSIVATPPTQPGMYRFYDAGGMIYFDGSIPTDLGAMIFMYDYGLDNNGDIVYRTQSYRLKYEEGGNLLVDINYHMNPDLTEDGKVNRRATSHELQREIPVLYTLKSDLTIDRPGSQGHYLMSTSPDGNTTVFTAQSSPLFDSGLLDTLQFLRVKDFLELGITGFHEKYAPHKKE